jgi:hypothetical protein
MSAHPGPEILTPLYFRDARQNFDCGIMSAGARHSAQTRLRIHERFPNRNTIIELLLVVAGGDCRAPPTRPIHGYS